jgi:putative ABC transport system permease protein
MFKNYFKTTFRNLWRNKTYGFINIIGLSIGTFCCLYILLYVEDQYSYDKHHKDAQNIYRVTSTVKLTGDKVNGPAASPPVGPL